MSEHIDVGYEEQIRTARADAHTTQRLGEGDLNTVFLVDGAETFRFPVSEEGMRTLHYETEILQRLAGHVSPKIPQVIEYVDNAYAVSTFVDGSVLKNRQIAAFSGEQKAGIGQSIATFMQELNAAMSVDQATALRQQYNPRFEDDARYYANVLTVARDHSHPLLDIYTSYYEQISAALPQAEPIVTHGDLHAGNLVFADDNSLHGVIDFGDFGPGTVYNELRILYNVDETIVQATIEALNGAFGRVDLDTVRLYAILHEVSVLVREKPLAQPESERKKVANMLLTQWLGENWEQKQ